MTPLENVLQHLDGIRTIGGAHQARCPAHDDQQASLSLKEGNDGRALVKCHAGCDTAVVVRKIGLEMKDLFPPDDSTFNAPAPTRQPRKDSTPDRIWTTDQLRSRKTTRDLYIYEDAERSPVLAVLRTTEKEFRQYRSAGPDQWVSGLGNTVKVPYRLPRIIETAKKGGTVFIVEGEKDVHTLERLGFVATTAPGGASAQWYESYTGALRGAHAVIIPDSDQVGRNHADKIANGLQGHAASVKVLTLQGVPEKGDVTDWIEQGHAKEEIQKLIESTASRDGAVKTPVERGRKSTATLLVELAREAGPELFHSPDGEPHATVTANGRVSTFHLKTTPARDWLRRIGQAKEMGAIGKQPIEDALETLSSTARQDGPAKEVYIRIGGHGGKIYLDLANEAGEVVEIGPDGWSITGKPPVAFLRPRGQLPLPKPVIGTDLSDLRNFLNVAVQDWPLVGAWLLAAVRPTGPYVILAVHGEQGSAKSTACRFLKDLIDPSQAGLRSLSKDEEDLAIAAKNGWVLAFDNLGHIDKDRSNALCRLSTKGALATRELYSQREEVLFEAWRPMILNGIAEAKESDLLDRVVTITLSPIPPEKRLEEEELWQQFHAAHPALLGALCSAVSSCLKNLPAVKLTRRPRMADFARWGTAAESALGLQPGEFITRYEQNRKDANLITLEKPLAQAIIAFMSVKKDWRGTTKELLQTLEEARESGELARLRAARDWPKNESKLGATLRELAPALRMAGVHYAPATSHAGGRRLTLTSVDEEPKPEVVLDDPLPF